eukprot:scaffold4103_cov175-Alexandrium_tamarense.AAC.2
MLDLQCGYWLEMDDGKFCDSSSANVSISNHFVPFLAVCSLQRYLLWLGRQYYIPSHGYLHED